MIRASDIIRAAPVEPCRPWNRHVLGTAEWEAMARSLAAEPDLALLALWGDGRAVHALFMDAAAREVLPVSLVVGPGHYPALSPHRPVAAWFERMTRDLWGHKAEGVSDLRPWLDHGRWPNVHPMAQRPAPGGGRPEPPDLLPPEDERQHQIPLGPVHGLVTEPGHFRFTADGETVTRLETRLGYAHKGQLAMLRGKLPRVAARFVARLSGDSTVAHSIAFARAAEAALETEAPPRAAALRAVMGEIERIANHLADIAAVCNEAGVDLPFVRLGAWREKLLRASAIAFGHRLMMDCVVPGGVSLDIIPGGPEAIGRVLREIDAELPSLMAAYIGNNRLADRLTGTGTATPTMARQLAAGGFVGRASGRDFDARRWPGYPPYGSLSVSAPVTRAGDIDARIRVRFGEATESLRLVATLLAELPEGGLLTPLPPANGEGIGVAEGFRGDCWIWLRLEGGLIAAAFIRDPGWAHGPLLKETVRNEAVGDMPLIGASFNVSHSALDL